MNPVHFGCRNLPINPPLIKKHSCPISSYPQNLHSVYGVDNIASDSDISWSTHYLPKIAVIPAGDPMVKSFLALEIVQ